MDELKEKGIKTETKILEQKIIDSDKELQIILGISKNTKILYIKRLMISGDEPLYITNAYFPGDIFPLIDERLLMDLSFTKLVEDYFNLEITNRKRIIYPDIPDKKTIDILKIKDKKVIMYIQTFWTVNYKGQERIIYFDEYFKGSKSRFVFESCSYQYYLSWSFKILKDNCQILSGFEAWRYSFPVLPRNECYFRMIK